MDEDRIRGAATNLGGKLKEAVGSFAGDARTRAEGVADQVSGRVQNAYGSAKDAIGDGAQSLGGQLDDFVKQRPVTALLVAAGIGYALSLLTRQDR